jgi:hypothetical protein
MATVAIQTFARVTVKATLTAAARCRVDENIERGSDYFGAERNKYKCTWRDPTAQKVAFGLNSRYPHLAGGSADRGHTCGENPVNSPNMSSSSRPPKGHLWRRKKEETHKGSKKHTWAHVDKENQTANNR